MTGDRLTGGSATLLRSVRRFPIADGVLDEEAARDWESLWLADPDASIFEHPIWADASVPDTGPGELILGDGFAVAIRVDSMGKGGRTLRFLTDPHVTDYAAPVGPDGPTVAGRVLAALSELEWQDADLDGVPPAWAGALVAAAEGLHIAAKREPVAVAPRIVLDDGFEGYLEQIGSKQRHEVRRKGRRLERELGPWRTRLTDQATLSEDLDAFVALHRRSIGSKAGFMTPGHEAFFRRVAAATLERGWLRLTWLETAAGARLATVFSFSLRDRWLVWNSAFDPDHGALSVGMIAMGEAIRLACEDRCRVFDLLRGDEAYKYRLGATDAVVEAVRLERGDR